MGDLSGQRDKVNKLVTLAKQNEEEKQWQEAFDNYTKALDIFSYMIKYEKNPKLKEKYMIFANDYIDRATNIKKTYLLPE